mmetsp:Transcript_81786/g.210651  ORF Transcript_81786/g.210651 Transcript_81786/m.210651 type:complete len:448 (+) Transcript_81786:73-1416(+)
MQALKCSSLFSYETSSEESGDEENGSDASDDSDDEVSMEKRALSRAGSKDAEDQLPPEKIMLLVMLCMFQGYAAMVGPLQQKFKAELHIGQVGDRAQAFTQAAVFVHYGKFVARLGHNVFLGCFSTMDRVYIAMALMFIGTIVPPLFVFAYGSQWVGTVFISYGLSGIGLGVFECTFLSVITPLGKLTKAWAIMGAPLGFGTICILGQLCMAYKMPVEYLYWYIALCIPVGMLVFKMHAPSDKEQRSGGSNMQASLCSSLMDCSAWLPAILPNIVAKVIVNFVMENVTPVNYYTYNAPVVPLLGPTSESPLLNRDIFFALVSVFILTGDTISRRVPASLPLETYFMNVVFLTAAGVCSIVGFSLEMLAIAVVTLIAIFMAFWGNGLVYGISAKYIDRFVPEEHNLAAYSVWCFFGDAGAIAGGSLVDVVRNRICGDHEYHFECRLHN